VFSSVTTTVLGPAGSPEIVASARRPSLSRIRTVIVRAGSRTAKRAAQGRQSA
jgi:hypothetical protein